MWKNHCRDIELVWNNQNEKKETNVGKVMIQVKQIKDKSSCDKLYDFQSKEEDPYTKPRSLAIQIMGPISSKCNY